MKPAVGNNSNWLQYDTYHGPAAAPTGFVGYTFTSNFNFTSLLFQEGKHYGDGGWWETLTVQVRQAGTWVTASGLTIAPVYPFINNGTTYQSYTLSFNDDRRRRHSAVRRAGRLGRLLHDRRARGLRLGFGAASAATPAAAEQPGADGQCRRRSGGDRGRDRDAQRHELERSRSRRALVRVDLGRLESSRHDRDANGREPRRSRRSPRRTSRRRPR